MPSRAAQIPFQGTVPPWIVMLGEGSGWSHAAAISADGGTVVGEVDRGDTSGAHFHGARWLRQSAWPPSWSEETIDLLPGDLNNPALAISPDGNVVAGACSMSPTASDPALGMAYVVIGNAAAAHLPFHPSLPKLVATAQGVVDGAAIVVGHVAIDKDRTDLDRTGPGAGILWTRTSGGGFAVREIDGSGDKPPSLKLFGITPDGTAVVGAGCSAAANAAYADVGVASEAVVYQMRAGSRTYRRRWLGFPQGSARDYSIASAVAVDPTAPDTLVVAGRCGGVWLDDIPNPGDRHVFDMRPARWRVTGTTITAEMLPLLQASPAVPQETQFGAATAISADARFIVGSCGTRDDEDNFRSDAAIWGRGSSALSIRELLMDAGITSLADVILDAATGISADGQYVCGYGHTADYAYFAWVARLPPLPMRDFDWSDIPRKLPNWPIDPYRP
jgi:uncharacterized membrane protein